MVLYAMLQAYWNGVLEWKTPNRKQKEKVIPQTE
jgi:hypothetical protein